MNSWNGMGRLTRDPELKTTQSGKSVTSFCVAIPNTYNKDADPYYIDCVAWGARAEAICRYFHKGKMIAVTGELQTRKYEDKQGNTRKATEVLVSGFSFCGDKFDGENAKAPQTVAETTIDYYEEELPF